MPEKSTPSSLPTNLGMDHISPQRLTTYLAETFNDEEKALELYGWGRKLSAAFFHDVSVIEVALRNALDRALVKGYGENWHRASIGLFDQRTYGQLSDGWDRLPAGVRSTDPKNGKIRGRLIASCMLGTWVSMLDAGGPTGNPGPCDHVDHDLVWTTQVLLAAFPGGKKIAGSDDRAAFDRAWVHAQVREVYLLRNRIAHHESLVNGFPVPGTAGENGSPRRRTVADAASSCLRLASMIDKTLAGYLKRTSDVDLLLASDPRKVWGFIA